jgi:peptidoglycan hydrolase-like protein with peptidoglycan-binding domain
MSNTYNLKLIAVVLVLGASLLLVTNVQQARAAGLTEAQIQAIMGVLSSFGADASVVQNVNTSLHGGTPNLSTTNIPTNTVATPITRRLEEGMRGSDVLGLQQFLISEGLLPVSAATGYFGPMTEAAVQNYQAQEGIVSSGSPETTGYGVVGPQTMSHIGPIVAPPIAPVPPGTYPPNVGSIPPIQGGTPPPPLEGGSTEPGIPGASGGYTGEDYYDTGSSGGSTPPSGGGTTVCSMDAMICPNGSSVGRSGPNCQFVCPGSN